MILLIDTDILLRAALFPQGQAAAALRKAFAAPFRPHIRAEALDELRRRMAEHSPALAEETEAFLASLAENVTVTPAPEGGVSAPPDDTVNLFLTGDRTLPFFDDPRALDAEEFLAF